MDLGVVVCIVPLIVALGYVVDIKDKIRELKRAKQRGHSRGIKIPLIDDMAETLSLLVYMEERKIRNISATIVGVYISIAAYRIGIGEVWYVLGVKYIAAISVLFLALDLVKEIAITDFSSKLPRAYQIIYIRMSGNKGIDEILSESVEDCDRVVKVALENYLSESRNNRFSRKNIKKLSNMYNNKFYEYLLEVLYEARIGGVKEGILQSMADMSHTLQKEVEYRKFRTMYKVSFMGVYGLFLYGIGYVEKFSTSVVGEVTVKGYYESPQMLGYKVLIYFIILISTYVMYKMGSDK